MDAFTLGDLYTESLKQFTSLENSTLDSNDSKKQEMVATCVTKFQDLWRGVDSAKVFSRNEELEDVATSDLKFFLTLYYLGDLQERIVDTNRVHNLRNAMRCFQAFMKICHDYSILSEKEYEQLITPLNPTDRAARVERLKKQKEGQALMAELTEKKKSISRTIQEGGTEKEMEDRETEFDSTERKYWLLNIDDKLRSAAQQLHMSSRECDMLASLTAAEKEEASEHYQQAVIDAVGRAPDASQMTVIEAPPPVPVVLTQLPLDREKILSEVFMDRNPPTMSDDEYCRQQMERMLPPDEEKKEDTDSEDEETADRKTLKAREWDNWKDDHAQDGNMGSNIG